MTTRLQRRDVLKSIGAGAATLGFAGWATAREAARYVVTARPGARIEAPGFAVQRSLAGGAVLLVRGPASDRGALEATSGVVDVARDFRLELDDPALRAAPETTDDEAFWRQWDKRVTDAPAAHETATGDGATVAVIDTGVDVGHPDLPNVAADAGRLFRGGEAHAGTAPVEFPADVTDLCAGTTTVTDHVADDVYYHGTHAAGIAAASRDGTTGVAGTAPDADVLPLRVFYWTEAPADCDGDGETEAGVATLYTTFGDILAALDYAAARGADAANMSIGTPPIPPQGNAGGVRGAMGRVVQSAVARGTVVVVSAGNAGADLQRGGYFTLPNSLAGAMSVSATGPDDALTFYSNYGTNEVDVGAPGGGYGTRRKTMCTESGTVAECEDDCDCDPPPWPYPTNLVYSTADPDSYAGRLAGGAEYLYAAGTSMAAPQVAGTAALVREVAPDATARQVEKAIELGADLARGAGDPALGAGRLNCDDALAAGVLR